MGGFGGMWFIWGVFRAFGFLHLLLLSFVRVGVLLLLRSVGSR